MMKKILIYFIIFFCSCKIYDTNKIEFIDKTICSNIWDNDTSIILLNYEFVKIDNNWYLPWGNNLLYREGNFIKSTPKTFFNRKKYILDKDTSFIWMDFDLNKNDFLENGFFSGVHVLIDKQIVLLSQYPVIFDTIYKFRTYDHIRISSSKGEGIYVIENKSDWITLQKDSFYIMGKPQYFSKTNCLFDFSLKRGLLNYSSCYDTAIIEECYYNISTPNYQNFIQGNLPKTKTINRNFFSKTGILSQYEKQGIQPITDSIFSFFLDTSSMLIYGKNYFHLSVNARIHTEPIELPKDLQKGTIIMKIPSLLRKEKSKFWVTPELYLDFGKVKQSEQLIFDFKAKKGTTWQVQKHKLFGGKITYIGKRDKITYQYRIEPNESNGFPNLVGFEVNEDWGFTRFDFRNDDGEIVSYDMIKD